MSEITLPSGNTVKLKDPKTLLIKDRNKVLSVANEATGVMQAVAIQEGLIAILIEEWSFDLIPPNINITSLENLTPADYEVLSEEAMKAQEFLFPSLAKTIEAEKNPKADTANSNG